MILFAAVCLGLAWTPVFHLHQQPRLKSADSRHSRVRRIRLTPCVRTCAFEASALLHIPRDESLQLFNSTFSGNPCAVMLPDKVRALRAIAKDLCQCLTCRCEAPGPFGRLISCSRWQTGSPSNAPTNAPPTVAPTSAPTLPFGATCPGKTFKNCLAGCDSTEACRRDCVEKCVGADASRCSVSSPGAGRCGGIYLLKGAYHERPYFEQQTCCARNPNTLYYEPTLQIWVIAPYTSALPNAYCAMSTKSIGEITPAHAKAWFLVGAKDGGSGGGWRHPAPGFGIQCTGLIPTTSPTTAPTPSPTFLPQIEDSVLIPSPSPTPAPTAVPSDAPTSLAPSVAPTSQPSWDPRAPTPRSTMAVHAQGKFVPTSRPAPPPSRAPSARPTRSPTYRGRGYYSSAVIVSVAPSAVPTRSPTKAPTPMRDRISKILSRIARRFPTLFPTAHPTPWVQSPTMPPTPHITMKPHFLASGRAAFTGAPSAAPTGTPTTAAPSAVPTVAPSTEPTLSPTPAPTWTQGLPTPRATIPMHMQGEKFVNGHWEMLEELKTSSPTSAPTSSPTPPTPPPTPGATMPPVPMPTLPLPPAPP